MFTPIRKTKKKHKWTEAAFLSALEFEGSMTEIETVRRILAWIDASGLGIWWGEGEIRGSFCPLIKHNGVTHFPFGLWTTGHVEIGFQFMLSRPVFNLPTKRIELVEKLNAIDGVQLPMDSLQRRPKFPLSALNRDISLRQFLDIWDWFIQEIRHET